MKKIFVVLAKLLGLATFFFVVYFLLQVVMMLPMLFASWSDDPKNLALSLLGILAPVLIALPFSFVLISKTEMLADRLGVGDDEGAAIISDSKGLFRIGLILMGVFFIVFNLPELIRMAIYSATLPPLVASSNDWTQVLSPALGLLFGLILAIKADVIAGVFWKGIKHNGGRG